MRSSAFGLIREIDPDDDKSWRNRTFLTFDIDWAHDEVIKYTIELIEQYDVPVTWFITHHTRLLERIRSNKRFDVGLHPNFNPLLEGGISKVNNAVSILSELCKLVPEATTVRSHSLVQSERLVDLFSDHGFRHASNAFIPINRNNIITPWRLWGGLTMVPHCWQDNVALKLDIPFPTCVDASRHLVVYDFHPIHVFLNTENLERYESTRQLHQKPDALVAHRFGGKGTHSRLMALLESSVKLLV